MQDRLVILHRKKPMVFSPEELGPGWSLWATCLRSLAFSFAQDESDLHQGVTPDKTTVYKGAEAYQFLLEVICGLHSPILGETEVFGQFKAFAEKWMGEQPNSRSIVQSLFADAKKIRQTHLSGLGSQSYGSWVRRTLNGTSNNADNNTSNTVHILGSGQLAKDILPWIIKSPSKIKIYCRSYAKALLQFEEYADRIEFVEYAKAPFEIQGALIVCAPVSSEWISENFKYDQKVLAIDLRDNSHFDILKNRSDKNSKNLFHLRDVFSELESAKQSVIQKVADAQVMLLKLCQDRFTTSQLRPYGWDDLCI